MYVDEISFSFQFEKDMWICMNFKREEGEGKDGFVLIKNPQLTEQVAFQIKLPLHFITLKKLRTFQIDPLKVKKLKNKMSKTRFNSTNKFEKRGKNPLTLISQSLD